MKEKVTNEVCNDIHCPFHSNFKTHGAVLVGKVIKLSSAKTIQIEIPKLVYIQKYERYEKRTSKLRVHNPPCINAKQGDKVLIAETRPISKTKNFVIVEVHEK